MSEGNRVFAENFVVNSISPQTVDNNSVTSDWVYAGNALNLVALVTVGATDAAVTATIEQAKDSSGTGAEAVTDASAAWTATDDNKDAVIQVDTPKLDAKNGFCYARLKIAVEDGTNGGVVAGVLINQRRHKPVTQPTKVITKVLVNG